MNISYNDLVTQLEPFKDKVLYHGLTETEIVNLEQKTGKSFPVYFREFLRIFGIRQDFVSGLLKREVDFIERTNYLPEEIKMSYVLIGDNGGEDFWLLNTENHNDTNLYEWQHWSDGAVVKTGFNFETLLKESIANLTDNGVEKETNAHKFWHVQFAVPADNEQKIYETIPLAPVQEWNLKEVSPAQVYCYETIVNLAGKEIKFERQESAGWASPIYYFNLKEPAIEFGEQSLIKDIDAKLKKAFPAYKLIDYGILALKDEDE